MSNTLYDTDFTRLLPEPLKNDEAMLALGHAIAEELGKNILFAQRTVIFPMIEQLSEELLDILAYDFKVDWYDYEGSLEEKRKTISECIFIHRYKGTKFAVETALNSIYSQVKISEWFEYGGEPFHFNITINDSTKDEAKRTRILEKVQYYKNLRSVLDSVKFIIGIDTKVTVNIGVKSGIAYKRIGGSVKAYGLD